MFTQNQNKPDPSPYPNQTSLLENAPTRWYDDGRVMCAVAGRGWFDDRADEVRHGGIGVYAGCCQGELNPNSIPSAFKACGKRARVLTVGRLGVICFC